MDSNVEQYLNDLTIGFLYLEKAHETLGSDLTDLLITKARSCRVLPSFDLSPFEFCKELSSNTRLVNYLRNAAWVHDVVKDYVNSPNFYDSNYGDIYGLGVLSYYLQSYGGCNYNIHDVRPPFSFSCYNSEKKSILKTKLEEFHSASKDSCFVKYDGFLPTLYGKGTLEVTPTSECVLTCASTDISGTFDDLNSLVAYIKDNLTDSIFINKEASLEFLVGFDCEVSLRSQIHKDQVKVITPDRKYQSLMSIMIIKEGGPRRFKVQVYNTLTNTNKPSLCKDIFSILS